MSALRPDHVPGTCHDLARAAVGSRVKRGLLHIFSVFVCAVGCNFPYAPQYQPQPFAKSTDTTNSRLQLYSVNTGRQICNPSASQDTQNFRGCMLFLNLEGALNINIPQEWASQYPATAPNAHDRLTIIDSSNTVRWFLMKPAFVPQAELQNPEWSRHPDYAAFLGDNDVNSDAYIVRISDKEVLRINNGMSQANSTPHVWLPDHFQGPSGLVHNATPTLFSIPATSYDSTSGMVDKETIRAFFGTDSVHYVFSKDLRGIGLTIYYIDYSQSSPQLVQIPRPQGKDGFDCESPLISPDGNWIVYNCKNGSLSCEAYLQQLNGSSQPLLLHNGMAAEPHWWQNAGTGDLFVLYSTQVGPIESLLDQSAANGSLGSTLIRRVHGGPGWLMLYEQESALAPLPFQGGLTRDGCFLVTGYIYGYIFRFADFGL